MNRNFLCNLFVLTLFSCWYIDARSLTYDDLKEEIKGLRSIIDRLKEKTDKEDIRINKLTDIVSQDNTVNGDHVRLSRNKRGLYRLPIPRRRRPPSEIGFLVSLSRHQLPMEKDGVLMFDHVITNIGNAFSIETGTFECRIPGTYMFDLNLVSDVGSYVEASIKLNGMSEVTSVSDHRNRRSGWDQGSAVAILILKKGDVVSVSIDWPIEPQTLRGEGKTAFSGYLLRRHRS